MKIFTDKTRLCKPLDLIYDFWMIHRLFRFPGQEERVLSLDTVRFLTATLVLFFHFFEGLNHGHAGFESISWWLRMVAHLFFVSFFWGSGLFLTTHALKEIKSRGSIDVRKFIIKRVLRTWPLYFLLLLVFLFLNFGDHTFRSQLWSYVFFFQNFFSLGVYLHSWSMAIEEQFYMSLLLLSLFARPTSWAWIFGALLLGSIAGRWWLDLASPPYPNNNTLIWSDALILGCLWAWMLHFFPKHCLWIQTAPNLSSLAGVSLFVFIYLKSGNFPLVNRTLLPLGSLMFFYPIQFRGHFLYTIFNRQIALPLSNLTYSLYLAQGLYLPFAIRSYFAWQDGWGRPGALIFTMALTLLMGLCISAMFLLLVEKPLYRLRNHLLSIEIQKNPK